MTTLTLRARPSQARQARWPVLVNCAAVLLAVVGAVLAGVSTLSGGPTTVAVATPVETFYGSFTVTRASTTFVPTTQGAPTAAKMMGTVGSDQLQVWVRLVNEEQAAGLHYGPDQIRLVLGTASDRRLIAPSGSSLEAATLPMGAGIEGQVWFDLPDEAKDLPRQLQYTAPDGSTITVPLPAQSRNADGSRDSGHHG